MSTYDPCSQHSLEREVLRAPDSGGESCTGVEYVIPNRYKEQCPNRDDQRRMHQTSAVREQ